MNMTVVASLHSGASLLGGRFTLLGSLGFAWEDNETFLVEFETLDVRFQ